MATQRGRDLQASGHEEKKKNWEKQVINIQKGKHMESKPNLFGNMITKIKLINMIKAMYKMDLKLNRRW